MSDYPNAEQMAFPIQGSEQAGTLYPEKGLSKREHFAALAMQGFCAGPERPDGADIAKHAVQVADHLLAALEAIPAQQSGDSHG